MKTVSLRSSGFHPEGHLKKWDMSASPLGSLKSGAKRHHVLADGREGSYLFSVTPDGRTRNDKCRGQADSS